MSETEKDRLLRLYKLLWEQINDGYPLSLINETEQMRLSGLITLKEMDLLDEHILNNKRFEAGKAFVQRMIKELENDK